MRTAEYELDARYNRVNEAKLQAEAVFKRGGIMQEGEAYLHCDEAGNVYLSPKDIDLIADLVVERLGKTYILPRYPLEQVKKDE